MLIFFNHVIFYVATSRGRIQFCASGSFSPAQKELYSKALKGYYKLRRDFISFGPNVKTVFMFLTIPLNLFYFMVQKYGVTFNSFSPLIFLISNVIEPYQEGILISNKFFDSSYASFSFSPAQKELYSKALKG
jgi:hypothetical protein